MFESSRFYCSLFANHNCSRRHFFYFSKKTSLDISSESSAWQTIHMKCQDLFSLKKNKNICIYIECHLLQILLGTLRVNDFHFCYLRIHRQTAKVQIRLHLGRVVCPPDETLRGSAMPSLAFGRKLLASLEIRSGCGFVLIPFFSPSLSLGNSSTWLKYCYIVDCAFRPQVKTTDFASVQSDQAFMVHFQNVLILLYEQRRNILLCRFTEWSDIFTWRCSHFYMMLLYPS